MKRIIPIALAAGLTLITSCDNDEARFSSLEIQNALFEMKGTYHGKMRVSYYHGDRIAEELDCKAVSRDSMTVDMNLVPMATTIGDESIATRLREIGTVPVKSGYEFLQMDDMYSFVLHPDDVTRSDATGTVRIVFSQNFGGDANYSYHNVMLNLSPTELWIDGEKYEPFSQLVYHFEGTYE